MRVDMRAAQHALVRVRVRVRVHPACGGLEVFHGLPSDSD